MTSLAFALAATIRHDGHGGVADLLATPPDATAWLDRHHDLIVTVLARDLEITNAGELRGELVRIRGAVRTLFARAVAPEPPSKADADRLLDAGTAVRMVNRAADRLGTAHLNWPDDEQPAARWSGRTDNQTALLIGAIGRSTIDFLAGPDRARLRACPAARCVKYFLQDDPRQTWCSPSCGNRERVNRHYRRQHGR